MPNPAGDWSIRSLLGPVMTRLLIYGTNSMDAERILQRIEGRPLRNAKALETLWLEEWGSLARTWTERGCAATAGGHLRTAGAMFMHAARCQLARFLINTSDLDLKKQVYLEYARAYRTAADHFDGQVLSVEIPLLDGRCLDALLHLPATPASRHSCVAIFAGLGSCKEEMHTLARTMAERGMAALVPDMPGCGESLFSRGVSCSGPNLEAAYRAVADFVGQHPLLDPASSGVCGLCMGGGYAYRAAGRDPRYRYCATLFPLFINEVEQASTPLWMRSGSWYEFQTGGLAPEVFLEQVGLKDDDALTCPFFLTHGRHDNWMSLTRARVLFERAPADRRHLLIVDEEPVHGTGQAVTHAMPVGEQMHWVAPVIGDWLADQARALTR